MKKNTPKTAILSYFKVFIGDPCGNRTHNSINESVYKCKYSAEKCENIHDFLNILKSVPNLSPKFFIKNRVRISPLWRGFLFLGGG